MPVKLIRLHAEDCIYEYKWRETSEWYAGGVERRPWALGFSDAERPIWE